MIKLAVFDMDGTVFESNLNWLKIREELNIPKGSSILQEIYKDGYPDTIRLEILERYEEENTLKTKPIDGVIEYLCYLENKQVKTALVTNNNKKNTDFLLTRFNLRFNAVITREMQLWKPDPDAFFYVMKLYGSTPEEIISIGDSHYDIRASQAAHIPAIFIIKNKNEEVPLENQDGVTYFDDYYHLKKILETRMPG
ncbi:MAG TPA: HAD-IA family hydrolase [Candidatus Deferrimicrobium sp.]|nr:HAD-IA family hydrolase [Candidatus Kapabacteria bacterium]HLP60886.1 HAD-IA family hydrolase [Candidatus Deferrimicrobium sp.]